MIDKLFRRFAEEITFSGGIAFQCKSPEKLYALILEATGSARSDITSQSFIVDDELLNKIQVILSGAYNEESKRVSFNTYFYPSNATRERRDDWEWPRMIDEVLRHMNGQKYRVVKDDNKKESKALLYPKMTQASSIQLNLGYYSHTLWPSDKKAEYQSYGNRASVGMVINESLLQNVDSFNSMLGFYSDAAASMIKGLYVVSKVKPPFEKIIFGPKE